MFFSVQCNPYSVYLHIYIGFWLDHSDSSTFYTSLKLIWCLSKSDFMHFSIQNTMKQRIWVLQKSEQPWGHILRNTNMWFNWKQTLFFLGQSHKKHYIVINNIYICLRKKWKDKINQNNCFSGMMWLGTGHMESFRLNEHSNHANWVYLAYYPITQCDVLYNQSLVAWCHRNVACLSARCMTWCNVTAWERTGRKSATCVASREVTTMFRHKRTCLLLHINKMHKQPFVLMDCLRWHYCSINIKCVCSCIWLVFFFFGIFSP